MELKFVETIEGKEYEAEFEAPSDFNLHLERVKGSSLVVSQRGTASGEYAAAFAKGMYEGQAVIDYDFGALVYPKYIKVVSGSEVVSASVNFNEGGGSGSGESGESSLMYIKNPGATKMEYFMPFAFAVSAQGRVMSAYDIGFYFHEGGIDINALEFIAVIKDKKVTVITLDGQIETTFEEHWSKSGLNLSDYETTESEFYNLDA